MPHQGWWKLLHPYGRVIVMFVHKSELESLENRVFVAKLHQNEPNRIKFFFTFWKFSSGKERDNKEEMEKVYGKKDGKEEHTDPWRNPGCANATDNEYQ